MKEEGQESHKNIILPKYVMNQALQVYQEIDKPPKSMYKAVGYNDMNRVKIVMEGDDAEKRDENAKSQFQELQKSKAGINRA